MAVRERVWVFSTQHNYTDRRKILIKDGEYDSMTVFREPNTHWNYGDFINASCISSLPVSMVSNLPNYLLILLNGKIESRWYVTNVNFISGEPTEESKWSVSLMRDVVVDYRSHITNSVSKIERGTLKRDVWSNVLVQQEGLNLNEIKVGQKNIKSWDNDAQWLTIFYDITSSAQNRTITFDWNQSFDPDFTIGTVQNDYTTNGFTLNNSDTPTSNTYLRTWTSFTRRYKFVLSDRAFFGGRIYGEAVYDVTLSPNGLSFNLVSSSAETPALEQGGIALCNSHLSGKNASSVINSINGYNINKVNGYTTIRNRYDGRTIDRTTVISRLSLTSRTTIAATSSGLTTYNTALDVLISAGLPIGGGGGIFGNEGARVDSVSALTTNNLLNSSSEIFDSALGKVQVRGQVVLPAYSKLDELNMGCISIPFGSGVTLQNGGTTYNLDETSIKSIFTTGWTNIGTAIKDIQVLPYCPSGALNSLRTTASPSNNIVVTGMQSGDLIPMTLVDAVTPFYYAVACRQSSMDYRYPFDLSEFFGTDIKMDSVTKKVRLVSHNHKQIFEFNPTRNNGITHLSFQFTLRPFNTIFRICPVFNANSLYGGNYQDARGLVYEGGFSLSQVTDAWVEYKLHNSTYEAVFNREVKNLEVSQDNARLQETLNYQNSYANSQTNIQAAQTKMGMQAAFGAMGTVAGVATKGPAAMLGGVGLMANAMSQGVSIGASQEIADRNLEASRISQGINDTQRAEDMSYKTDMFDLSIAAIKAQPGSVSINTDYSKVNNTKCYVEIYDCTPEEKMFIEDIFRYMGMRVGRIDNVLNYLDDSLRFIRLTILFSNGLLPNITNAINAELSAGIYCTRSLFEGGN